MANRGRPQMPPGFDDPFGGFGSGGFGSGFGLGGQSLLGGFFQNDPFNDPFFTRPFAQMDSLFGRMGGSMFNTPMLAHRFGQQQQQQQQFLENRSAPHMEPVRTGPTIEELPDDTPVEEQQADQSSRRQQSSVVQEPIVEHPDDEEEDTRPSRRHGGHRSSHGHHRGGIASDRGHSPAATTSRNEGGPRVFSYSSMSSYSSNGPQPGLYYSKTTTTRMGPDGVAEQQSREEDSRSATETVKYARALGNKARSVVRTRKAGGEEESLQTLHNVEEDEAPAFDEQWQQKAERSLPRWYDGSGRALPDQSGGSSSRMALPPNTSGSRNTRARGVRHA